MAFDHWLPRTFGRVPGKVWVPALNCLGKAKEFKAGAKEYTSTTSLDHIPCEGGRGLTTYSKLQNLSKGNTFELSLGELIKHQNDTAQTLYGYLKYLKNSFNLLQT